MHLIAGIVAALGLIVVLITIIDRTLKRRTGDMQPSDTAADSGTSSRCNATEGEQR
jgi:hypothetical protein